MRDRVVASPHRKSVNTRPTFGPRQKRELTAALVFLAPLMIGMTVFIFYPLIASAFYTFTKWDLIAPGPKWIGFENWKYLIEDERIRQTLGNTFRFLLTGTTSYLLLSFLLAIAFNSPRRFVAAFRGVFLLPWMMSGLAAGVVWTWMFNSRSGPAASLISLFTDQNPNLLLSPQQAMTAIAIATTWQGAGYGMIIFIAGLNNIPPVLYEAARIDGANAWHRLRYITLPMLGPTILFIVTTALIGGFQLFDPVVAMTPASDVGGPNGSTRTLVLYLYQQMFELSERHSGLGYASAIAWMLAIVILAATLLQWFISRQGAHRYEGD